MTEKGREMRKIVILFLVILFTGGIGYQIYQIIGSKKIRGEKVEEVAAVPVKTEKIKLGTVEEKLSLTGNITPQSQVTVYSEVAGEIERLVVDVGDKVKKGDLIAQIECEKIRFQVEQMKVNLKAAKVNLANTEKEYGRIKRLYYDVEEPAVSRQRMDNITAAKEVAEAQVESLEAGLALAKAQLSDYKIYVPIKGIIAKKFIDEGEMIIASMMMKSAPIVTIVNMDTVKIMVNVTEKNITQVKIGQKARVKVDAYPDKIFIGKVSNISPVLDPSSKTAPVEIKILNPDHLLKPGMFARVNIVVEKRKNALLVPIKAVLNENNRKFVFVANGSIARKKEVKTGIYQKDSVEIMEGLNIGENVIIEGNYGLKDGAKVLIKNRGNIQ